MKYIGQVFGIDFDGTCVTHEFPEIGTELPNCVNVLKRIVDAGGQLVLNTMRSDRPEGNYLQQAVDWFSERGLQLYGANVNPTQKEWTTSPKVYAHIYIDDAALGVPLMMMPNADRPSVDWFKVEKILFD